ncbi:vanZ like family protein [bacterium BMS3Abin03]|nr:vanZ like family protein [bacterium BMS3Abin03]
MFEYLEKNKVYLVYTPLVVYWLFLILATSLPAANMPKIAISDKIEHFGAFFGLSVLLSLTLLYQQKNLLLKKYFLVFTLIIVSGYGVIDEIHQAFIPGRNSDILDWTADSIGAITAVLLIWYLVRKLNYKQEIFVKPGRDNN